MMRCELRQGRWQDALADVGEVDAVCADLPYGARTHAGQDASANGHAGVAEANGHRRSNGKIDPACLRRAIDYAALLPADVRAFVAHWSPRCRGWVACMTSHDLIPVWQAAYEAAGRYAFAPVPIIQPRVRLGGDGPASCAVYLMVARPSTRAFSTWGALPGWYKAGIDREGIIGGKPVALMREIVRDYTRPGNLVVDPCSGGGTTLVAAYQMGRHSIGAEMDPATFATASARIAAATRQPDLWHGTGDRVRVRAADGGLL